MKIRYNGEEAMCHIGDTYTLQKSQNGLKRRRTSDYSL